jgi:predicted DNA-binding protein YlxM (UPF0122 family)
MSKKIVPTLQNRYVILTGDLKSSRKLEDRAKVQEGLKNALLGINKEFEKRIIAKFIIVGGDGFQCMLHAPKYIFDIYYALFENINYPFYLGIGIGGISTNLSENVGEIDGEAFHKAYEALEKAKKENIWIAFKSESEIDEIVTYLLNFIADVMWNWTKRQREIVMYYKKVKDEKRDATLEEIAENIGIKKQTISKILKRSRYKLVKNAGKSFADFVSRK